MSFNQTYHPDKFVIAIDDRIRNDRVHGASELAREALKALSVYANILREQNDPDFKGKLISLALHLHQIRPSMTPIENLLGQWLTYFNQCQSDELEILCTTACDYAERLEQRSKSAAKQAAENALSILSPNTTVMTHSLSSTISALFQLSVEKQLPLKAIITASDPSQEGKKLASLLSQLEIPTTYITDAQIGLFVKQADIIITGADTITKEDSLINKSGTYLLALAAKEANVPFYICSESFKRSTKCLEEITLEEMNSEELHVPLLPNVTTRNIYFDATPSRLIKGWITEDGVTNWC